MAVLRIIILTICLLLYFFFLALNKRTRETDINNNSNKHPKKKKERKQTKMRSSKYINDFHLNWTFARCWKTRRNRHNLFSVFNVTHILNGYTSTGFFSFSRRRRPPSVYSLFHSVNADFTLISCFPFLFFLNPIFRYLCSAVAQSFASLTRSVSTFIVSFSSLGPHIPARRRRWHATRTNLLGMARPNKWNQFTFIYYFVTHLLVTRLLPSLRTMVLRYIVHDITFGMNAVALLNIR